MRVALDDDDDGDDDNDDDCKTYFIYHTICQRSYECHRVRWKSYSCRCLRADDDDDDYVGDGRR